MNRHPIVWRVDEFGDTVALYGRWDICIDNTGDGYHRVSITMRNGAWSCEQWYGSLAIAKVMTPRLLAQVGS